MNGLSAALSFYRGGGNLLFNNCSFFNNTSTEKGLAGAFYSEGMEENYLYSYFKECKFYENSAYATGGLFFSSSFIYMLMCLFKSNFGENVADNLIAIENTLLFLRQIEFIQEKIKNLSNNL